MHGCLGNTYAYDSVGTFCTIVLVIHVDYSISKSYISRQTHSSECVAWETVPLVFFFSLNLQISSVKAWIHACNKFQNVIKYEAFHIGPSKSTLSTVKPVLNGHSK